METSQKPIKMIAWWGRKEKPTVLEVFDMIKRGTKIKWKTARNTYLDAVAVEWISTGAELRIVEDDGGHNWTYVELLAEVEAEDCIYRIIHKFVEPTDEIFFTEPVRLNVMNYCELDLETIVAMHRWQRVVEGGDGKEPKESVIQLKPDYAVRVRRVEFGYLLEEQRLAPVEFLNEKKEKDCGCGCKN